MPNLLAARPPLDAAEERPVRRLARRPPAPADGVRPARMIARSGEGRRPRGRAQELDGPAPTVRERFPAFHERGRDGLGLKQPGSGRPPRLTAAARRAVLARGAGAPPGRLLTSSDGTRAPAGPAGGDVSEWALDALAAAAQAPGILIGRRPIRRRLRRQGVRWRQRTPCRRGAEHRPGLRPTRTAVVAGSTDPPAGATPRGLEELGPVSPRPFPPAPGRSPNGPRIQAPREDGRADETVWVYGAWRGRDGQAFTCTAAPRRGALRSATSSSAPG